MSRSNALVGLVLLGCTPVGSEPEAKQPEEPVVVEAEPGRAGTEVRGESESEGGEESVDEPARFEAASFDSGSCVVRVVELLEAEEYRGPGPITPAIEASLNADPEFARMYQAESHGDHHIQCHYAVELEHEPGKRYRWREVVNNTLRDRTAKICNSMAAEVAEDIARTTKDCKDLDAGAYYGSVLEPMP